MAQRQNTNDDRGGQMSRMAPGGRMTAITPADGADNCPAGSTLYVGTGGTLVIIPEGNEDADTVEIIATDGQWLSTVTIRRVLASGTDAEDIYAVHN